MLLAALFLLLAIALAALVFVVTAFVFLLRDKVPYVPTPPWVIAWLSQHVRLDAGSTILELGCGDARVLCALVRANPGTRGIGYERNWWPYVLARIRSRGLPVEIRRDDFYKADLRDVRLVFCYLLTDVMPRVETFVRGNLQPGACFASYAFALPSWPPAQIIPNPKPKGSRLYIYNA
jgi:hypothetical protein